MACELTHSGSLFCSHHDCSCSFLYGIFVTHTWLSPLLFHMVQSVTLLSCAVASQLSSGQLGSPAGSAEIVNFLLERGADIRAVTLDGYSALHAAAEWGHAAVMQRLLQQADVELVNGGDEEGWTALHNAAEQGSVEVVQLLLQVSPALTSHQVVTTPACT